VSTSSRSSAFPRALSRRQRSWASRYRNGDDRVKRDVLDFAFFKFRGFPPHTDREPSDLALLAALSIRILVECDQSIRDALMVEQDSVHWYMRVIFSIPEHQGSMSSGTPSEPILAEAAGRTISDHNRAIRLLARTDSLVRGDRAHLAMRLLCTLAHDSARGLPKPQKELSPDTPEVHKPIRVLDFLRRLFPAKYSDLVLKAKPCNREEESQSTLEDAFADAWVHFSQFIDVGDQGNLRSLIPLVIAGEGFRVADFRQ
jgi:hypothetical protein